MTVRAGARAAATEATLALGVGGVVALAALGGITSAVALGVVLAGLGVLIASERSSRLPGVAHKLVLATAFAQPMSGLALGPFELGDYLLLLAVGTFVLIRLRAATIRGSSYLRLFRPLLVGVGLIALGGVAGALAEPHEPFIYTAFTESADISGFSGNMAALARLLIGTLGPFALFILARPDRERLRQILFAFVAGAAVSAAAGLLLPQFKQGPRAQGLAPHPVHFGTIGLLAIGCAVALAVGRRRVHPIAAALLPLLVVGLIASGSRAALGGLIAFLLLVGPVTRMRSIMASALVGALLVGLILLSGAVRFSGENALARTLNPTSLSASGSNEARADLRDRALDRWKQVPLTGSGLSYIRVPHNVYVGLLVSGGLFAIAGALVIIIGVVRAGLRARHDVLAMVLLATYLAYLGLAWFDNTFYWRWLWFFVSMTLCTAGTAPPHTTAEPLPVPIPGSEERPRPGRGAAAPRDVRAKVR